MSVCQHVNNISKKGNKKLFAGEGKTNCVDKILSQTKFELAEYILSDQDKASKMMGKFYGLAFEYMKTFFFILTPIILLERLHSI